MIRKIDISDRSHFVSDDNPSLYATTCIFQPYVSDPRVVALQFTDKQLINCILLCFILISKFNKLSKI